ncbi:MAG: HvfC/BufC family peptide modification chaperone [Burkholderiales bacterium]
MSELAALQRAFGAALTSLEQAAEAAPMFRGSPDAVLARFAVYRGNVVGTCTKALAGAYPIVAKIVGESFFEGLAREYLRRYPSTNGDLNEFGAQLAEFVAHFRHTQDLPYLPDVARMEWLVHRAHYAADEARPGVLLAPACALLASLWPLARIWEVHQDDYEGEFSVDFEAGPERVLIYRPRFRVLVGAISAGGYRFLERLDAGAPLQTAREAALIAQPGFDLGAALAAWIEAGVIVETEDAK